MYPVLVRRLLVTLDLLLPTLVMIVAAVWLGHAHAVYPAVPTGPASGHGFFTWYDQAKYLGAALAWSQGDLEPIKHWYLPGYAWLAVPFLRITPEDPFLIPDIAGLALSAWLFSALGARLCGGAPGTRALSALVFLLTSVGVPLLRTAWVVPWTTTPAAAGLYGFLLAALRLHERISAGRAMVLGLVVGLLAWFRPTEAALASAVGAAFLATRWRAWPALCRATPAALAGLALPLSVLAAGHIAIFGFARGGYLAVAANAGFEPALLPLRWAILVLDPRPLLFTGPGLARAFPWLLPGLAGGAALLLADRLRRPAHALVFGLVLAYLALYLSFRDLHPTGLWHFQNYHYFKWLLPVLALYALLWCRTAWRPGHRRAALAGLALTLAAIPWRPTLTPAPGPAPFVAQGRLVIPGGLPRLDDAVLVHVTGGFESTYVEPHVLQIGAQTLRSFYDFRLFPRAGMGLLEPLRKLPPGEAILTVAPVATLDSVAPPQHMRIGLRFDLPCLSFRRQPGCRPPPDVPGTLPLGTTIVADSPQAGAWLTDGWSTPPDPGGRWTDGNEATLAASITGLPPTGDLRLTIEGRVFAPASAGPAEVVVIANGAKVATWHWPDAQIAQQQAVIPRTLLGPAGALTVEFVINSARSPAETGLGPDPRKLGLFLRTARLSVDQ